MSQRIPRLANPFSAASAARQILELLLESLKQKLAGYAGPDSIRSTIDKFVPESEYNGSKKDRMVELVAKWQTAKEQKWWVIDEEAMKRVIKANTTRKG